MSSVRPPDPGEQGSRLGLREAKEVARRLGNAQPREDQPRGQCSRQPWRSAPASRREALTAEAPISTADFKVAVRAWAERLDVEPAEIHLTRMHRKWASCSQRGRLTFDTALLAQPEEFRREAIVHELLHLKVPNHGPLFRALLSASLGRLQPESTRFPS